MNRRGFLKGAPTTAVMLSTMSLGKVSMGEELFDPFAAKPTAVEELRVAIEGLFEVKGHVGEALVYHQGTCLPVKTYVSSEQPILEYDRIGIDAFYPDPVRPVQVMWENVKRFKKDIRVDWTPEMLVDFDPRVPILGTVMWWRKVPELIKTANGLYTVRMRAKFA